MITPFGWLHLTGFAVGEFELAKRFFHEVFNLFVDGTTVFGGKALESFHERGIDAEWVRVDLRHVNPSDVRCYRRSGISERPQR